MAISIQIDGVSREYGPVKALDNVTLDIKAGEFFTLLGSSGCGKSSLLKLIGGFDRQTSGRVAFDGKDVGDLPANKRPVNTVFQSLALFPHMSVAQNVGYGLRLKGLSGTSLETRINGCPGFRRTLGLRPTRRQSPVRWPAAARGACPCFGDGAGHSLARRTPDRPRRTPSPADAR